LRDAIGIDNKGVKTVITNDYLKTKLEAERQRLKEHTDRYGDPTGGTAGALTVRSIKARIAMLEEIVFDLECSVVAAEFKDHAKAVGKLLSVSEPRPAFKWPSEFLTPDE
jgi:hypothetical protein